MQKTDQKLVMEAIRGNKKALNELIEQSYQRILYTSVRKFGQQTGEDVAHKIVIEVIQSVKNIKEPGKYDVWLARVINLVCTNELKLKYRDQKVFAEFENGDPDVVMDTDNMDFLPEEYVIDAEKRAVVLQEIEKLPQNYQDVLFDFFYQDMSYEQIAEVRGISVKKVGNDLYRGRMLLKKRLEALEGKEFTFVILPVGAMPSLAQVFQADASAVLTPELCSGFLSAVQQDMAKITLRLGKSVGVKAAVKIVASSLATFAVAGGLFMALNHNNPAPEPEAPVSVEASAPSIESTPESTHESTIKLIVTVADMIGEDEARELEAFEVGPVDEDAWLDFLDRIGAKPADVSIEHDTEYAMYLLNEQDKQLMIAERKDKSTGGLTVFSQFGDTAEPPLMIEIIMLFGD